MLGCSQGIFTFCFGDQGTPNHLLQPEIEQNRNDHIAIYQNRLFRFDESVMDVSSRYFAEPTKNLRLFFGYNAGAAGKIYYFKQLKQNGNKLYILPVRNISTGDVEMYDVYSNTIMPRTGTLAAPQ